MDLWTSDGLAVLDLKLVRSEASTEALEEEEQGLVADFAPEFVYPIFGEAQTIFGYSNLSIKLQFASSSLFPYLEVKWGKKIQSTDETKADEIEEKLYDKLPADYLKDAKAFKKRVEEDELSFKPIGTRIGQYGRRLVAPATSKGKGKASEDGKAWESCEPDAEGAVVYEAWTARTSDPGFKDLLRRMQIFILLYIEAGTFVEEDDENWEFVVLYEKRKRSSPSDESKTIDTYHFAGYSSIYSFLHYPDQVRLRLSQFIILPPFQGAGHGSALYSIIYFWIMDRNKVAEIGIEDPSEGLQDLRDKMDLGVLIPQNLLADQKLPLDKEWQKKTRAATKLNERQFARLVEMLWLLKLGKTAAKNKDYRLMVKERLYRFNYDRLTQLEPAERKEKLGLAFQDVVQDYSRLTAGMSALSSAK